jgi:hypothetical protein
MTTTLIQNLMDRIDGTIQPLILDKSPRRIVVLDLTIFLSEMSFLRRAYPGTTSCIVHSVSFGRNIRGR